MKKFFSLLTFLLHLSHSLFAQKLAEEHIETLVQQIKPGIHIKVAGNRLYSSISLPTFYKSREYRSAWNEIGYKKANDLIAEISASLYDGLLPNDYHCNKLIFLMDTIQKGASEKTKAEFDILLTDAFFMLCAHLNNGKTDPLKVKAEWKIQRALEEINIVEILQNAINQNQIRKSIKQFRPTDAAYAELRTTLKDYIEHKPVIDWQTLTLTETLKVDSVSNIIPSIRERLWFLGDLQPYSYQDSLTTKYDSTLWEGVKKFQYRHGLTMDGEIGRRTLQELNVSPKQRIETIRANLERLRWLPREHHKTMVLVNIAQFKMFYIANDDTVFKTKAIVGRSYRKTPVFDSKISFMVLSPTWTIPPGILTKDVLPAIRKDPNYLTNNNMSVIDRQGNTIQKSLIDFNASKFPYKIRQAPGPNNALGGVKFMFPNSFNVYIHDTPSKNLFAGSDRALSSGCIRIEKAFEFAQVLLKDKPEWTEDSIRKSMSLPYELRVNIRPAIPVYIVYFTAWSDGNKVYFRNDVYQRDEELIKGLNQSWLIK